MNLVNIDSLTDVISRSHILFDYVFAEHMIKILNTPCDEIQLGRGSSLHLKLEHDPVSTNRQTMVKKFKLYDGEKLILVFDIVSAGYQQESMKRIYYSNLYYDVNDSTCYVSSINDMSVFDFPLDDRIYFTDQEDEMFYDSYWIFKELIYALKFDFKTRNNMDMHLGYTNSRYQQDIQYCKMLKSLNKQGNEIFYLATKDYFNDQIIKRII